MEQKLEVPLEVRNTLEVVESQDPILGSNTCEDLPLPLITLKNFHWRKELNSNNKSFSNSLLFRVQIQLHCSDLLINVSLTIINW